SPPTCASMSQPNAGWRRISSAVRASAASPIASRSRPRILLSFSPPPRGRRSCPTLPPVPLIFPPPVVQSISRTSTDFAVTIGGGVTIRTGPHLAFEVDVRYLGFLGRRDLNVGRYGAGISYVF